MRNPFHRLGRGLKAASAAAVRFPQASIQWFGLAYATTREYERQAGDGRQNSIVEACVRWGMRTFPEAPAIVLRQDGEGQTEPLHDHPLTQLLRRPNPSYGGALLWGATLADFTLDGNAYWLKVRATSSPTSTVTQLWWVPSTVLQPMLRSAASTAFIDYYEYRPGAGMVVELDPANVVHFRNGFDPANVRKGLSPLKALAREIVSDDEAGNWTASILHNMGVPGVVIVPGKDSSIPQPEAEEIKQLWAQKTTGTHRGEPLVLDNTVEIKQLGFTPEQMMPHELRNLSEERISGVIGIPAIVAGLGAGLKRSTFANYAEARQAAYESYLIPTQRLFSDELGVQLLPDFGDPTHLSLWFDTSKVRVLQDDEGARIDRIYAGVGGPVLLIDEARAQLGLPALPNGQGQAFYVPTGVIPTPAESLSGAPPPAPVPPPTKGRALTSVKVLSAAPPPLDASAWVADMQRIRDELERGAYRDLVTYFSDQRDRVLTALRAAGPDASVNDLLDAAVEEALLRTTLDPHYVASLRLVQNAVMRGLGMTYTFLDQQVQTFLAEAGQQITGITATTRDAVRDSLIVSADLAEGPREMATRLAGNTAFSRKRARTVSRTEMGNAANLSSYANYQASGVVAGVTVLDGDDDEVCADANGTDLTMDEYRSYPKLGHPNCTRAFAPSLAS